MTTKKSTINNILEAYIAENAQGAIKGKGKRIYNNKGYELKNLDIEAGTAKYHVKNDHPLKKDFEITIRNLHDKENVQSQCTCPYSWVGICKHRVAVLLDLKDRLLETKEKEAEQFEACDTLIKMKVINEQIIRSNLASEMWPPARQLAFSKRAKIIEEKHHEVEASVVFKEETHIVNIKKKGKDQFATSCTCKEQKKPLCIHKAIVLLQLKFEKGARAFDYIQDREAYKGQLLKDYGFAPDDDLEGKFYFKEGKYGPELVVLDNALVKMTTLEALGTKYRNSNQVGRHFEVPQQQKSKGAKKNKTKKVNRFGVGYAFNFWKEDMMPGFEIIPIVGKLDEEETDIVSHVSPLLTHYGAINTKYIPKIEDEDIQIFDHVQELSWRSVADFARENTEIKVSYTWNMGGGHYISLTDAEVEESKVLHGYLYGHLQAIFDRLEGKRIYKVIKPNKPVTINNIASIRLSKEQLSMQFGLNESGEFYRLTGSFLTVSGETLEIKEACLMGDHMVLNNNVIYLKRQANNKSLFKAFIDKPSMKVRRKELSALLQHFILPMRDKFPFNIEIDLTIIDKEIEPEKEIHLNESENYLIIQPLVAYDTDNRVELNGMPEVVYEQNEQIVRVGRNTAAEQEFKTFIEQLHPSFKDQQERTKGLYFYIDYEEVMKEMWFVKFVEQLQIEKIGVYGFNELKNFKYNIHRPEMQMKVSSGIDWFDIKVDIRFGDQVVSLLEVQRALLKKEKFVKLNDGTLGLIPEDWVGKYATLFKLGKVKGEELQLSKLHFTLIDELYDEIDNVQVLRELKEKKQRLKNFQSIDPTPVPAKILATLRAYQEEGFNWFNFLDNYGWGGCLADDMGLGKTLQVLTFIQHLKQKYGDVVNLVIVPTSLIFVWEEEVAKFCPDLKIYLHHGPARARHRATIFDGHDIVLTTYGILTSDVELFSKYGFHYIILDESQAIKNPSTKRYKAVRLLKCQNRIALTGTPIENNTFDLFAQMNFLNPGMLGSMEFFKQEFANPIDKQGNKAKVEELRRLVYPFILRRTKELVAKELPEKTESILYCEMGVKQRGVYEALKNEYRYKILEKIEEDGMAKAGIYILEGLMKLRQICDSPALLKNQKEVVHESVKLKELLEHITEKTNDHKILIFSQFLGMLNMLKNMLEEHRIPYEYLDGSINQKDRQQAVKQFQTNAKYRVFLISLRAGGVGLNLTAADYVFLVDPWWNPAVEQQAIDRTHRIGQTKKVFAYKMICKNTIEEKILKLQGKKKALAAELISTEKSFIKKLTREDVEYLFS